jgi:hypothetical protein
MRPPHPLFQRVRTVAKPSPPPAAASDVQSAINVASIGDTVQIPAGTFNWSSGVSVKKQIKLLRAGTLDDHQSERE